MFVFYYYAMFEKSILLILFISSIFAVHIDDVRTWIEHPNAHHIKKGLGRHKFPYEKELANELQLINPQNIQKIDVADVDSSIYSFEDVSPLEINNDEVVVVSYYSTTPNKQKYGDWIGAYSPSTVDIKKTVPVKWGYCDEDPDYVTTGYGSLNFNLTNLRADVIFYYFTSGTYYPVMVNTSSQIVSFANINEPLRPRMVPTGDYDVFHLLWSSAFSTTPKLKWGTKSGTYNTIVDAETSTIQKSEMLVKIFDQFTFLLLYYCT